MPKNHYLYTPHYTADETFIVDHRVLLDTKKCPYLVELGELENEDSSNISWTVSLNCVEAENTCDKSSGFKLCKGATLFCVISLKEYVHAKIKWRVHQESDEETDSILEEEVSWKTYDPNEPEEGEKNVSGKIIKLCKFRFIPSLTRLSVRISCTWRRDDIDFTKISTDVETDLDQGDLNFVIQNLKTLHLSQRHCDVVFVVGEEEIPAHRAVLAAMSDVFDKMFEHKTVERETGRIEVEDATSTGFKRMLRCLYTTCEPQWMGSSDDDLLELTYLAHKYGLEVLQAQCTRRMVAVLRLDNVFKMIKAAHALSLNRVINRALDLIKNNKKVLYTEEWKKLREEDSHVALEILTQLTDRYL